MSGRSRPAADGAASRWQTIRYALDSNARTLRLCLIMIVASVPPSVLAWLVRH